jgi:hypothetical protein
MNIVTSAVRKDEAYATPTPLGEGEDCKVILGQALRATAAYSRGLWDMPVTGQAKTHIIIEGDSVYRIHVDGYGSLHGEEPLDAFGYLAPNLQYFTFVNSPSGVQVFPSSGLVWANDAWGGWAKPADALESPKHTLLGRFWGRVFPATLASVVQRESGFEKFQRLTKQWRDERDQKTSVSDMVMHPAYQQIIGMGREATPFILRELSQEVEPDHWFWALKAITGEDPVPPESRGKIFEMASAWLRWGREKGYR